MKVGELAATVAQSDDGIVYSRCRSSVSYPEAGNYSGFELEDTSFRFDDCAQCGVALLNQFHPKGLFFDNILRLPIFVLRPLHRLAMRRSARRITRPTSAEHSVTGTLLNSVLQTMPNREFLNIRFGSKIWEVVVGSSLEKNLSWLWQCTAAATGITVID